jgi:hypothetical protein
VFAGIADVRQLPVFRGAHGFPIMLGETVGLKGRAARAGAPVSALDPAASPSDLLVVPFRAGWVHRRGCHFYFARRVTFQLCADIGM